MKAVILAEETVLRPKPMVEIGGKPILWHIMKGVLWRQRVGAGVTAFSLKPPALPIFFAAARVFKGIDSLPGTIRGYELLTQLDNYLEAT